MICILLIRHHNSNNNYYDCIFTMITYMPIIVIVIIVFIYFYRHIWLPTPPFHSSYKARVDVRVAQRIALHLEAHLAGAWHCHGDLLNPQVVDATCHGRLALDGLAGGLEGDALEGLELPFIFFSLGKMLLVA